MENSFYTFFIPSIELLDYHPEVLLDMKMRVSIIFYLLYIFYLLALLNSCYYFLEIQAPVTEDDLVDAEQTEVQAAPVRRRLKRKQSVSPDAERCAAAGAAGVLAIDKFDALDRAGQESAIQTACVAGATLIRGITFMSKATRWRVNHKYNGKRKQTMFATVQYIAQGLSGIDARKAALRAAIAFRRAKENEGLKVGQRVALGCGNSRCTGVTWNKSNKGYRAQYVKAGKVWCGPTRPPNDDSEDAHETAKKLAMTDYTKLVVTHGVGAVKR